MKKTRTIKVTESYRSCDFCNNQAQYEKCFICEKETCKDHAKQFDVIDYDLVYICPDCEHKDYTKLKKLNDKYMRLCKAGVSLSEQIKEEINRLKMINVGEKVQENGN